MANVCTAFGWSAEQAIHTPLPQILCLTACNAWSNGLEPCGDTYEDMDFNRRLAAIRSKKKSTPPATPPPHPHHA